MSTPASKDSALLVHIEHSKPIEMEEFVSSLNALNSLYSSFVKKNGEEKAITRSKLYVEKIEHGCIDIYLCEIVSATLIPFMENANVIFDFASYIKHVYDFFKKGEGQKPELDVQECNNFSNILGIVASDPKGNMSIGAINKADKGHIFNNCTFNFGDSNSTQNQLSKEVEKLKSVEPDNKVYRRVLMGVYQVRSDAGTNTGNKAIIDEIYKGKKIALVFETDELKNTILFSEINPTRKVFQVDVQVQTANDKVVAYKVIALHEIIDLED